VKTKYKGPVFNAGRDYIGSDRAYNDLFENYAYLALNAKNARELGGMPEVTIDSLKSSGRITVLSGPGNTREISEEDSVFQLIGRDAVLASLFTNRSDVFKISITDLNLLKSPHEIQKPREQEKPSEETHELIDKQNRLIENQNDFIRMMLSGDSYGDFDSSLVLGLDTNIVEDRSKQVKPNSAQGQELYSTQDSIAMLRVTQVDSAHVSQWKGAVVEQYNDTVYIIRNADSAMVAAMESRLKQLEEENESLKQVREIENMDSSPSDTVFVREGENTEQIDQLEKRLNQLEEENKNLKESGKSSSENSEVKNVPSESDQALLEETKRRNDLLEQQVAATQKLAEKSVEPTQVVVESQGGKDGGGVNLTPGIVVPIGGRGAKKDNKEILENQKEMEARVDSLIRVITYMRATQTPAVTPAAETNPSGNNNVVIAPIKFAETDTTGNSSIPTDTLATDTLSQTDLIEPIDSTSIDTLNTSENFVLPPETLENPELEPDVVEVLDSLATQAENDTIIEVSSEVESENTSIDSGLDYPMSVYFGLNSVSLSSEDQAKLKGIADDLVNTPENAIVLEGHTDKSGDASYNEMLSKKRANAVKNYLVENGVSSSRITITPLGSKKADQAYNENSRRVDIVVK
ncbi:MAG: OmpA family protein, partial [Cryomorphaceae bacterium]